MQLANLAFAVGQVLYQRLRVRRPELRDREVFGLLYAGAFLVTLAMMLARDAATTPDPAQFATLLYLGVIASGLAFFLWNLGATRVSAGTLAVMNNVKIPLAVLCSLVFFGEKANLPQLTASLTLLGGAVWLAEKKPAPGGTS